MLYIMLQFTYSIQLMLGVYRMQNIKFTFKIMGRGWQVWEQSMTKLIDPMLGHLRLIVQNNHFDIVSSSSAATDSISLCYSHMLKIGDCKTSVQFALRRWW